MKPDCGTVVVLGALAVTGRQLCRRLLPEHDVQAVLALLPALPPLEHGLAVLSVVEHGRGAAQCAYGGGGRRKLLFHGNQYMYLVSGVELDLDPTEAAFDPAILTRFMPFYGQKLAKKGCNWQK